MSKPVAPKWLRAFDIIVGLLAVVLSVVVLVYQELAIFTLIVVLSVVMLIIGIVRVLTGIFAKYLPDGVRTLNFGAGLIAIALSLIAMLYTNLTTQVLIYLLAMMLLLNGVTRQAIGGFSKAYPKWFRALLIVVGLLTIVMAVIVFVSPSFGFLTLVMLVSFTLMLNGVTRIIQGITGTQKTDL